MNYYAHLLDRLTFQSLLLKDNKMITTNTVYRPFQKKLKVGSQLIVKQQSTIYQSKSIKTCPTEKIRELWTYVLSK